jgi:hypothetical protein
MVIELQEQEMASHEEMDSFFDSRNPSGKFGKHWVLV